LVLTLALLNTTEEMLNLSDMRETEQVVEDRLRRIIASIEID
jgi:hypothetical protein